MTYRRASARRSPNDECRRWSDPGGAAWRSSSAGWCACRAAPASSPGASGWPRRSGAAYRDEDVLGAPRAGLRRPRGARATCSASPRRRTAATAPAGSSPATARATGSSPRSTATGFANQPASARRGDGLRLDAAAGSAPRCAARRPANRPPPAERDACLPYVARGARPAAPDVRVIVCLGGFAWQAAARAPRPATAPPLRPRRRGRPAGGRVCSAASTPASRTPSPGA